MFRWAPLSSASTTTPTPPSAGGPVDERAAVAAAAETVAAVRVVAHPPPYANAPRAPPTTPKDPRLLKDDVILASVPTITVTTAASEAGSELSVRASDVDSTEDYDSLGLGSRGSRSHGQHDRGPQAIFDLHVGDAVAERLLQQSLAMGWFPAAAAGDDRRGEGDAAAPAVAPAPVAVPPSAEPPAATKGIDNEDDTPRRPRLNGWIVCGALGIAAVVLLSFVLALLMNAARHQARAMVPVAVRAPLPALPPALVGEALVAAASVEAATFDAAAPVPSEATPASVLVLEQASVAAPAVARPWVAPALPIDLAPVTEQVVFAPHSLEPIAPGLLARLLYLAKCGVILTLAAAAAAAAVYLVHRRTAKTTRLLKRRGLSARLRDWQWDLQRTGRPLREAVASGDLRFNMQAYAVLTACDLRRVLWEGFHWPSTNKASKAQLLSTLGDKYADALFEMPKEEIHDLLRIRGKYAPAGCSKFELVRLAVEAGI